MYIIAVRVHSSIFISVLTCAMNSPKYRNTLKYIYLFINQVQGPYQEIVGLISGQ